MGSGMPDMPKEARREEKLGVPECFIGTSVFMMPKVIKMIARHNVGLDIDGVICYYQVMGGAGPAVQRLLDDRDQILAQCSQLYGVDREAAKKLFLRIGFLGSFDKWLKENKLEKKHAQFDSFVETLQKELHKSAEDLMKRPELKAVAEKRSRPLATALSLHYMDKEREFLNQLGACLPPGVTAMSYEHDGIVVSGVKNVEAFIHKLQPSSK